MPGALCYGLCRTTFPPQTTQLKLAGITGTTCFDGRTFREAKCINMNQPIAPARITLHQGDLTTHEVDALVNAANARLAGGGGVDGAIHRRGGSAIMEETRRRYPQGCPTGSAVISGAGRLTARYVIHAVGPVWQGGDQGEAELLASALWASFDLAREHGCRSLAAPALSTGAYGYPLRPAADVSVRTAARFLGQHQQPEEIRFVLFDAAALRAFQMALEALWPLSPE